MAFLEKQPIYIRKKIALFITIVVGLLLVVAMFLTYKYQNKDSTDNGATTKIGQFYTTIIKSAQSYFGGERAIINK
jgi:predicted negative regulator of RcsB-dependent stress response